ncbi:GNAT family N-acetyltransferase [Ureibacillus acetophenoni]|uniref:Ribosomal protein S18 acetylase RimI-like enzyme n=1 Tax=Ureibacillus acetophenoni TaxID=614649 RepID=A0A285UPB3_9BACL|nr:GNAT family N-acetyltransferase [Ureibacillus acetophenoni]SOC43238.1 ribosomal protein S18 acetylase RimI-like enzyme [Ureibacillus acetophenoni]
MNIKKLAQCTLDDVLTAWNEGFEGYFVQIKLNAEAFLNRLVGEGLSPSQSIVAFDENNPVGIVLNGFRQVDGKKIAWNGGTGVATDYRGKGVSRAIMEETLEIYKQENVEVATLEVIKENERAIKLYEKYGYEITDHLLFISGEYKPEVSGSLGIKDDLIRPEQLSGLSFYKEDVPWQCGWQSAKQGEAKVFYNDVDKPLGYAIYRRVWNDEKKLDRIVFHQLELLDKEKVEYIPKFIASITTEPVNITTINFSASNPVSNYFIEQGLKVSTEQYQMKKING